MIPPGSHHVAILPTYALSETALRLSRVIEREANRRSALRGSGLLRVEQNFPLFRRVSSSLPSSFGRGSVRSRRSVTSVAPSVAPTPEEPNELDSSAGTIPPPSQPIPTLQSPSFSPAPSPRASVKAFESFTVATSDGMGPEDPPLTLRGRVWEFFDDPQSSPAAYYFSVSLFFFIVLSTIVFIAQTDKSLARHRYTLSIMETLCAVVFTVEYALRAIVSPSKWTFLKTLGNWVDLAAILPFYLEAILAIENAGSFGAIRIVRLTRVARVLKMSRYSSAIQMFVQAISISMKALSMLFFLMAIAVVVFSSAIYFAEFTPDGCRTGGWIGDCDSVTGDNVLMAASLGAAAAAGGSASRQCTCVDPNPYSSIAESFWWSIVTMSTVGYGDMTPVTLLGRIVGIATILTGMLVLALPITVIGTNFQKVMKSVMQQTMKSNVDYLKGKRQICREEIEAILQRFHAVTTDIHLNIDDIIQVYDTDNSGTLEDGELARFRRDLEMLQNRAFMNQHMDLHAPTAAVTIAAPLAVAAPQQHQTNPKSTMGALIRKLSSRSDIFSRSTSSKPTPPPPMEQEPNSRQTIAVAHTVTGPPVMRPSHSEPGKILTKTADTIPLIAAEARAAQSHHPLMAEEHDMANEISAHPVSGPSSDELQADKQHAVSAAAALHLYQASVHPGEEPQSVPYHHRSSTSSSSRTHSHRHSHHHNVPTDELILQRLAEMQRTFENRLLETEERLESKMLYLTKMLMRVEKLIELSDQ